MLTGIFLSVAISTAAVPPGYEVENHAHPAHNTQPTIRHFERRDEEYFRRVRWEKYCLELGRLWKVYRESGSTFDAWRAYNQAATEAKRQYIYGDPFYAPILP